MLQSILVDAALGCLRLSFHFSYLTLISVHITYLHQYFNTPDMPGSTRSFEFAKRLVAMGHEVTIITSWRENDARKGWFCSTLEVLIFIGLPSLILII